VVASHALAAVGMGLPWPLLLVTVDGAGSELLLGLAGAARLAPYVALSWLSGRLADRRERARIVRLSIWSRVALLAACAAAMYAGSTALAVGLATLAVVAGTPAYPALAAGMPRLAGPASTRATSLLVTAEVGAFVVGPALGGLFVGRTGAGVPALVGALACLTAGMLFRGTTLPAPEPSAEPDAPATRVWEVVRHDRSARHALVVVATVNAGLSTIGLALIGLSAQVWATGEEGFGVATAVLGFGALAAPLLAGRRPMATACGCLLVMAASVAGIGLLPWPTAPVALAAVGAVSTCCESVATGVIQASVPDVCRASVLGLADSVMVGAALLAALVEPWLGGLLGTVPLVLAVSAGTGLLALTQRPRMPAPPGGTRAQGQVASIVVRAVRSAAVTLRSYFALTATKARA